MQQLMTQQQHPELAAAKVSGTLSCGAATVALQRLPLLTELSSVLDDDTDAL
jgi:hypothetical protein